jgi:hypothetical protein
VGKKETGGAGNDEENAEREKERERERGAK